MTQRSKSTLFLIEQLIVIAVFAICAAACVSIMTTAFFFTNDSASKSNAIIRAESAAELFKATGGDFTTMSETLGGLATQDENTGAVITVFYDSLWNIDNGLRVSYVLRLAIDPPSQSGSDYSIVTGEVSISRYSGEELISFQLAARTEDGVMRNE